MRLLNSKSICTRKPSCMTKGSNYASLRKGAVKYKERRTLRKCKGGALDGHGLYLSTSGTLAFKLNGMRGFYNHKMEWVSL